MSLDCKLYGVVTFVLSKFLKFQSPIAMKHSVRVNCKTAYVVVIMIEKCQVQGMRSAPGVRPNRE